MFLSVSPPSDLAHSDQDTENSPLTHLAEMIEFSSISAPISEPVGPGSNPGPAAPLKSKSRLAPLPCMPQNLDTVDKQRNKEREGVAADHMKCPLPWIEQATSR